MIIIRQLMDLGSSLYSLVWSVPYLLLVPVWVLMSPLCIISSSLFQAALGMTVNIDDQTVLLILMLLGMWGFSAVGIFQLVRNRTCKCIFFYEFVLFLTGMNFILIGITYSLLGRNQLLEQVLAKICTTLLLILTAEKLKNRKTPQGDCSCKICFQLILRSDGMILPCQHSFHEACLWQWLYVRNVCPTCLRGLSP